MDDYWISPESIDSMDIQSPFVTVDSNRINATFNQLFNVLKGLQRGMSTTNKTMAVHAERMTQIEADNATIKEASKALKESCSRNEVNVDKVTDVAAKNAARIDALERKLKSMEQQGLEMKGLADSLIKMKSDIAALQQDTDSLGGTLRQQGADIKKAEEGIVSTNGLIDDERRRIGVIYKVFEMDEREAGVAVSQMRKPDGESTTLTSTCKYILSLPSFAHLGTKLAGEMAELKASLDQRLSDFNQKVSDELALLGQQIRNKLDVKVFAPFEKETKETLTTHTRQLTLIDKLSAELSRKADKIPTEEALAHLQKTKADRSELQNVLTRDELERLAAQLRALQKAFDALESKMNLELQSQKSLARGGGGGGEIDPSLAGRVSKLERETAELYDIKVDRAELLELQRLFDARPNIVNHTRTATPDTPKRHGSLQPLQAVPRPSSASSTSSTMQYTSSINPLSPNNYGKYRATAVLYDSDGRKTSASVTAARAVGAVEHWNNVARHNSSTPHDIPEGYKVHEV